jgi:hypothetical protein
LYGYKENMIAKPLRARIPLVINWKIIILLKLNVIYEYYDKKDSIRLILNEVLVCIYLF